MGECVGFNVPLDTNVTESLKARTFLRHSVDNQSVSCLFDINVDICADILERFLYDLYNKQEGDGDFSQISSEENDFQLDDELPSNMVSTRELFKNSFN